MQFFSVFNMNRVVLAAFVFAAMVNAAAASDIWIGSWGAAPVPPSAAIGPFPAAPSFKNQTVRQIVRISAGGSQVRLRFSNEFGKMPLVIGAAHLAMAGASGAIIAGTDRALTFGGSASAVIPPGAPLLSDPVTLSVPALSNLAVSLYLPQDTGPCTCHTFAMATGYVSGGDVTAAPQMPDAHEIQTFAFLTGVDVNVSGRGAAVVVLGDSLSDGTGSTADANHRWPDFLAERLYARDGAKFSWGIVNEGIAGNRLNADGVGQSALARFDRDVLSVPGAAYVVVLEGINDIGVAHIKPSPAMAEVTKALPPGPSGATDLIATYRQLIARAHDRGLKAIGVTITPYGGVGFYYSSDGEADREVVNSWIRTGGAFDGVIDFDSAWRDPKDPTRIIDSLQAGDHLHGNDTGYRTATDSIDLDLFSDDFALDR